MSSVHLYYEPKLPNYAFSLPDKIFQYWIGSDFLITRHIFSLLNQPWFFSLPDGCFHYQIGLWFGIGKKKKKSIPGENMVPWATQVTYNFWATSFYLPLLSKGTSLWANLRREESQPGGEGILTGQAGISTLACRFLAVQSNHKATGYYLMDVEHVFTMLLVLLSL